MKSIQAIQNVLPALVLIVRPGRLLVLDTAVSDAEAEVTGALAQDLDRELRALQAAVDRLNR